MARHLIKYDLRYIDLEQKALEPIDNPCGPRLSPNVLGTFRYASGSDIIEEVDEGIWLVSFIDYDLGYIDLEQRTLQTLDNPFGPRLSPMS